MRFYSAVTATVTIAILGFPSRAAFAQDEPTPIGPFVLDVRGTFPKFPDDDAQLAQSRGVGLAELPGRGLGVDAGAHVYLFKWKTITVGVGGQMTLGRSQSSAELQDGVEIGRAVTATFVSVAPQLSFNFGTGDGWSYISGGIGKARWSTVPAGQTPIPGDQARVTTINYGGGARWFAKPRLAFTFDVRFHAIYPGAPYGALPGSPRTTMLIIGAGVSLK
jgi:hypothetical protein